MSDVYVLDAVRTPFGRYGGALAEVRPDDLAAHVLRTLLERSPDLDPAAIEDVILGDANQAGEDNRDVARMAALLAGMPTSVPGSTVNRLCGSGLDAAIGASRAVQAGDASLMIAGGVESMSRAPWVLQKPERGYPRGHETLHSTTLGWRMVNPAMPSEWTVSLGESAESLADRYGISREAQDAFAVKSHLGAAAAWAAGVYDDQVVPVPGTELTSDEGIRAVHRGPRATQAGVPSTGDGHGGQLLAVERRRRGPADRRRGRGRDRRPDTARPHRRPRCRGRGPARVRHRPGRGGQPGAEACRHRLG
jgi:acetyl-CoA acyltransferase